MTNTPKSVTSMNKKKKYRSFSDVKLARESKQKKRAAYIPVISIFIAVLLIHGLSSPRFKSDLESYFFSANLELLENPNLTLLTMNDTSKCNLCTYKVRNTKPNSSPKDVLICNAIGKAKNCILFVKTLRTTGSKAKCVFLVDSHAYASISQDTKQIVENCGGQIINCGPVPFHKRFDGHNYCYVFSYYFIQRNMDKIDRVMICDMYDTVFQGDPFNEQIENDKLNIVDEGATFSTIPGESNREWLLAFNYTLPQEQYNDYYLCSGYIAGKAKIVLQTLKLYLKNHSFGKRRHDQAAFNYLYFSGILSKNNISIIKRRQNELVRHISYVPLGNHSHIGDVRGIRNESIYATIIHHYYLDGNFQISLLRHCPRETKNLEKYLGRTKESKVIEMENFISEKLSSESEVDFIYHKHNSQMFMINNEDNIKYENEKANKNEKEHETIQQNKENMNNMENSFKLESQSTNSDLNQPNIDNRHYSTNNKHIFPFDNPFQEEKKNKSKVFPMILPNNLSNLTDHLNLTLEKPYSEEEELNETGKYMNDDDLEDELYRIKYEREKNRTVRPKDVYSRDPDKKIKQYYTKKPQRKMRDEMDNSHFYEKDINDYQSEAEHEIKSASKGFHKGINEKRKKQGNHE